MDFKNRNKGDHPNWEVEGGNQAQDNPFLSGQFQVNQGIAGQDCRHTGNGDGCTGDIDTIKKIGQQGVNLFDDILVMGKIELVRPEFTRISVRN